MTSVAVTYTQVYTVAGTFNWVAPAGVSSASIECWGSGGGGAGGGFSTRGGSGGGGGEYAAELSNTITPGNSYTVVVGAGGVHGTGGANGTAGASSSFTGTGATTVTAHGGGAGQANSGTAPAGGTGSTNSTHFNGGAGGTSAANSSSGGGGGGGSGGSASIGNAGGTTSTSTGGAGGVAVTGGGAGGKGGDNPAGAGTAGSSPGGGGGGGSFTSSPIGADGSDGKVAITYTQTLTSPFTLATNGTYTFTAPTGVSGAKTECWAAGGGGGGCGGSGGAAGGGAGGEYAAELNNLLIAGNTYTIVVGAAGTAGGVSGTGSAGTGGNTTFSGTGATTVTAHGGAGAVNVNGTGGNGGAGGTGSSNSVHFDGGAGGLGSTGQGGAAGGGGSGGTGSAGNAGQASTVGHNGATAVTGGGPGGNGSTSAGVAGSAPASGPGGGGGGGDGTSASGGSGFDGQATITLIFGTPDLPQVFPGPTWLRRFKPGLPKPRPIIPPPGPYFGDLPNLSDVRGISPGPTWLRQFKPGVRKPRPFIPSGGGVSIFGGLAVPSRPGMSGSVTESPGGIGGLPLKHPGMSGTVHVPVVTSGSLAQQKPGFTGLVKPPVVTSGGLSRRKPSIVTPPTVNDLPHIMPGPAWLNRFGRNPRKRLKIPAATQFIGSQGAAGLNVRHPGIAGQIIQYLPFPQFTLSTKFEILINGTWLDITGLVYQRNDIVISRGLPDETQSVTPSQMTLTLNNRDGRFSPKNPLGAYFPYLTRNVQFRFSIVNQASASGVPYSGYRFWGEVSSWPPKWDPTGTDVYCDITVSGVLRRFVQGAKLGSTLRQYYTSLTGDNTPYAIWPCEDGSQASEIASALPSVDAMSFTGAPGFAQDSSFGGSDPLPGINSSVWHGQTGSAANPPGTGSITQNNPGTYHWTAPPGVTAVTSVQAIGSGGGGGDQNTTIGGGGGGGGGTGKSASVAVTAGTQYTYVVGAGGAAGSGGTGSDGADSTFTGDAATVTGKGGKGGAFGGSGGAGGAGNTFTGGSGAAGRTAGSSSQFFSDSLSGNAGASGGGNGAGGTFQSTSWTAPDGVTSVDVTAQGAGGGGQGGGATGTGVGGGGGGGGGFATGNINVTPGNSYSFEAGNGGAGGSNGVKGNSGGHSGVNGDSVGCFGNGGSPGSGGGNGGGGGTFTVGSGSGSNGSGGGDGANPASGKGGGGGGGGGSAEDPGTGHNASGRNPGGGGGSGSGGGWGTSSYPGSTGATGGGTGGQGGGGGGGGSTGANSGKNGGGGGAGFVQWSWEVTTSSDPTAGGGGSSAGTSSAGSNGSTNGQGGTAPSGGGNGGTVGSSPAGAGPGGGGAGALTDTGSGAGIPGAGGAGQVKFSWSGGATSPVAADIVRFCLDINSAGITDGSILLRALTYGTVAQLDLIYHTGGLLELKGYNSSSVQIFDSGSVSFSADGNPLYMSLELTASGSNVLWKLTGITPGSGAATATASGSVAGQVGNVSDIFTNPNGDVTDSATSIGWITVQTYADSLVTLSDIVNGFAGETAADRIERLCLAQGIGFTLVGDSADTPLMGPQQDDTFVNVLQSCADFDRGQIFETRDQFGIGYRTRVSMQGQDPVLTADYSLATLAENIQPVADDQYTRNDITATRNNGASSRAFLDDGSAMSIAAPPNGVGDYTYSITVQALTDSQLPNFVAWLLTVGTVDEYRYPQIVFDMSRIEVEDLFATIAELDVGDFVQITTPPTFLTTDPISQLSFGFTETINAYKWVIAINAVPESPYSEGDPPTW